MKKETPSADARPGRYSFRHSFSLTLLLGNSSRSSENTTYKQSPSGPQDSKPSFVLTGSSSKLATELPVYAEDFADSDTSQYSQYSAEDVRTAESIYSVIREYEPRRLSFWFNEEFDRSDESYQTSDPVQLPYSTPEEGTEYTVSDKGPSTETVQLAPGTRPLVARHRVLHSYQSIQPNTNTNLDLASAKLPDPDVLPMIDSGTSGMFVYPSTQVLDSVEEHTNTTSNSLLSGELLTRLDGRNSVSSELALHSLIAGVDSESELPVMVYSVHDRQHAPPSPSQFARLPPAIPVQMRDGTSLRRVSVLTRSNSTHSRNWSPRLMATARSHGHSLGNSPGNSQGPGQGQGLGGSPYGQRRVLSSARLSGARSSARSSAKSSTALLATSQYFLANTTASSGSTGSGNTSTPGVFSNVSAAIPEIPHSPPPPPPPPPHPQHGAHSSSSPSRALNQKIPSPAPSVTRDSIERHRGHEKMFYDSEKNAAEMPVQQPRSLDMPWSKWLCMMVAGLVAVPVFFLLAVGAFDHGGFARKADRQGTFSEKTELVNWRFRRRYTRPQKLASLILGLAWVSIVAAMIAVGFGVGVRRQHA